MCHNVMTGPCARLVKVSLLGYAVLETLYPGSAVNR